MIWNGGIKVSTHGKDQQNSQNQPMKSNNLKLLMQKRKFARERTVKTTEELSQKLKRDSLAKVGMHGPPNIQTVDSNLIIIAEIQTDQKQYGVLLIKRNTTMVGIIVNQKSTSILKSVQALIVAVIEENRTILLMDISVRIGIYKPVHTNHNTILDTDLKVIFAETQMVTKIFGALPKTLKSNGVGANH